MVRHLEARRYIVEIGEGGTYLVDFDEFNTGYCSCRDFECRYLPKLIRLEEEGSTSFPALECKHLRYAREHLEAKTQRALKDSDKEVKQ